MRIIFNSSGQIHPEAAAWLLSSLLGAMAFIVHSEVSSREAKMETTPPYIQLSDTSFSISGNFETKTNFHENYKQWSVEHPNLEEASFTADRANYLENYGGLLIAKPKAE